MTQQSGPGGTGSRPPARRPRRRRWRWLWRTLGILFLFLFMAGVGAAVGVGSYVYQAWKATPDVDDKDIVWSLATVVYDRHGQEVTTLHGGEERIPVKLSEVPRHVIDAFVAIEDSRFWHHFGVDPIRILGAAWHDLKVLVTGKGDLQGASTITQQLARNAFLSHQQTLERKIKEALLAIKIEQNLSKQEILEKYLNEIWFGQSYYGIGTAAKVYFGKKVQDLTLAEGAMLAGMVKNPARYNPYTNMEAARERMELVLSQMVRYGYITPEQAAAAREQKLTTPGIPTAAPTRRSDFPGDDFVDYVIRVLTTPELAGFYGIPPLTEKELFHGGYRIYTTLDPAVQVIAEEAVAMVMNEQNEQNRYAKYMAMPEGKPEEWIQAAVVVMEPGTGAVRAMVGGRGPRTGQRLLNRATDTLRQPGSTMKPLAAYVPAVELLGYGPGTVIDDSPLYWDDRAKTLWPKNYSGRYGGLTPLRDGLAQSINAMAARLVQLVGPGKAFEYAEKLGIRSLVPAPRQPHDQNLSLALGGLTRGVSVLDLATAYSTIANLGLRVDPVVITRIEDHEGRVIFEARPRKEQVIKPSTAYLVIDMLKDVIRRGTAYSATRGFNGWPVAGKTGTTERNTDAWFVGFSRQWTVAVWNGYDNRDKQRYLPYTGGTVPAMVWNEIMRKLTPEPPPDWERPRDVVRVTICKKTGLLPSPYCPETTEELFVRGTEPTQFDDQFWTVATVVQETVTGPDGKTRTEWRLYRPGCPGIPEQRVFLVRPDYVRHPDPARQHDPRYVPADAAMTVPTEYCSIPDGLVPGTEGLFPDPGGAPAEPPDGLNPNPRLPGGGVGGSPGPGAGPGAGLSPGPGAGPGAGGGDGGGTGTGE